MTADEEGQWAKEGGESEEKTEDSEEEDDEEGAKPKSGDSVSEDDLTNPVSPSPQSGWSAGDEPAGLLPGTALTGIAGAQPNVAAAEVVPTILAGDRWANDLLTADTGAQPDVGVDDDDWIPPVGARPSQSERVRLLALLALEPPPMKGVSKGGALDELQMYVLDHFVPYGCACGAPIRDEIFDRTGCNASFRDRPQWGSAYAGKHLCINGPSANLLEALDLVMAYMWDTAIERAQNPGGREEIHLPGAKSRASAQRRAAGDERMAMFPRGGGRKGPGKAGGGQGQGKKGGAKPSKGERKGKGKGWDRQWEKGGGFFLEKGNQGLGGKYGKYGREQDGKGAEPNSDDDDGPNSDDDDVKGGKGGAKPGQGGAKPGKGGDWVQVGPHSDPAALMGNEVLRSQVHDYYYYY
jgi:hypothetical protein